MRTYNVVFNRTRFEIVFGTASTPWERVLALLAAVLSAAVLAVVSLYAWRSARALDEAQAQLQTLRSSVIAGSASARANPEMPLSTGQRQHLNAAIRHLNTPWGELLDGLEARTPEAVFITSIESVGDRSTVRLQAVSADIDTLLQYAASLSNTPDFVATALLQQDAGNPEAPARLSFELVFRRPEGKAL